MIINFSIAFVILASSALPTIAATELTIKIKNHMFEPNVLEVPAGEKIKLIVINEDPTPEEFESYELNREKIIGGNSKGVVFISPLKAGEYPFFGEFNEATAQGKLIAK